MGNGAALSGAFMDALAGYFKGTNEQQLQDNAMQQQTRRNRLEDQRLAYQMSEAGFVPTASIQSQPDLSTGAMMNAASGGVGGPGLAFATAMVPKLPPRYGAQVGDFTKDESSPAAQTDRARLSLVRAQAAREEAEASRLRGQVPSAALRQSLINAGASEDEADAALASGDPVAIRGLLHRVVQVNNPMPSHPSTRPASAEPPAHRDARQGAAAVRAQISDTQGQLTALNRTAPPLVQFPGIATGTAADSASAQQFKTKQTGLQQRADSLRGVADRLTQTLTGGTIDASHPAAPAAATHMVPSTSRDVVTNELTMYRNAVTRINQVYANDPKARDAALATAKSRYDQRRRQLASPGSQD